MPRKDQIRPIPGKKVRIEVEVSEATANKLERLKGLLSHRNPNPNFDELLGMIADIALKKVDYTATEKKSEGSASERVQKSVGQGALPSDLERAKIRSEPSFTKRDSPRSAQPPVVKPRSISVNKRRIVWKEAQAKCTYVDPNSGRRCGSRHQLEVDHRIPVAKGGSAENENLRLLCRAHNLLMAEKHFGASKITSYKGGGQGQGVRRSKCPEQDI